MQYDAAPSQGLWIDIDDEHDTLLRRGLPGVPLADGVLVAKRGRDRAVKLLVVEMKSPAGQEPGAEHARDQVVNLLALLVRDWREDPPEVACLVVTEHSAPTNDKELIADVRARFGVGLEFIQWTGSDIDAAPHVNRCAPCAPAGLVALQAHAAAIVP